MIPNNNSIDWPTPFDGYDYSIVLPNGAFHAFHDWNNFAVIPKVDNLRKGNKNSVHD
jgi:hypothetical protein